MPTTLTSLAELARLPFDDIIDVRSPAEFAEDHVPGAISLPVLSNEERAQVGTLYKQVDPFVARKVGAALVSRNAANHLEGPLADRKGSWRPLVYCWRGGQRSGSFASILAQIGWRADTVKGGYKAFRALVVDAMHDSPLPFRLMPIDGMTGTAKTALLHRIAAKGGQVIDLEGAANHRGSLFGAMGEQPSQKMFETRIAMALAGFDPAQPVFVESEAAKVGDLLVPPSVWKALSDAPRLYIEADPAERAAYLAEAYADVTSDVARLSETLTALTTYHGRETIAAWQALAEAREFRSLAAALMEHHYDPRYRKAEEHRAPVRASLQAQALSPSGIDALAETILNRFG